ncbi:hypothetical protein NEOLEDRAFT_1173294 [Neolentinus lepideus HHB14362 ss-1]|uniref:F-box domain-containing protein n=1 Tax=Neolentinus lepideus HHB14362 ss-1 TaxID=1314782 RepID=A0A165MZP5_9AGAM|nr:hypothetical protein NEOLEDRAFT_1173294 [Neolentinus lepideus HHB14362 ss-1]
MASLAQLPDDILLDILVRLSIPEVLSLKQTCRALYSLTSSDYLWHQLALSLSLPLPLPPDTAICALPASELQLLCTAALRLDANWSNPDPAIRRFTPVLTAIAGTSIDEIRWIPGAQWLVTAQRNRPRGRQSTSFTFWAVPLDGEPYRAAAFEGPGYYRRFSVVLHEAGGHPHAVLALTVTTSGEELLQVYRVALSSLPDLDTVHVHQKSTITPDSSGKITLLHHIKRPAICHGMFYQVLSYGDVVVSTLVNLYDAPGRTDHILLLNIQNGVQRLVRISFKETLERVHIALYPAQLVIIGALEDTLLMVDLPRLGPAGRRALWLQRNVETEEVRVVRAAFPCAGDAFSGGDATVATLLGAYPNLPFRPNAVRALAFDEARGRVGVGLFNGEVYVLEY